MQNLDMRTGGAEFKTGEVKLMIDLACRNDSIQSWLGLSGDCLGILG